MTTIWTDEARTSGASWTKENRTFTSIYGIARYGISIYGASSTGDGAWTDEGKSSISTWVNENKTS